MKKRHNHDRLPNKNKFMYIFITIIFIAFSLYYFGFFGSKPLNSESPPKHSDSQLDDSTTVSSNDSKSNIVNSFTGYQNLNQESMSVYFSEGNRKVSEDVGEFNSLRFYQDSNTKEIVFLPKNNSKESLAIHYNIKDVSVISASAFRYLFELINSSFGSIMRHDIVSSDMIENISKSVTEYEYIDFSEFFKTDDGKELSKFLTANFFVEPFKVFVSSYDEKEYFKSNAFVVNEKNLHIGIGSLLKSKAISSFVEDNFGFSKKEFDTNPQAYTSDFLKKNNIDALNIGIALTPFVENGKLNEMKILFSYKKINEVDPSHFTVLVKPTSKSKASFSKETLPEGELLSIDEFSAILMGNPSNNDAINDEAPSDANPSIDVPSDAVVGEDIDSDNLTPTQPLENDGFIDPLSKFSEVASMPSTLVSDFVGEDGIHYQTYSVDQYDEYGGNNDATFVFYYTEEGMPIPISLKWSKYVDEELTHYYDFSTSWVNGVMQYEIFYGHVSETGELLTTQVTGFYDENNSFQNVKP